MWVALGFVVTALLSYGAYCFMNMENLGPAMLMCATAMRPQPTPSYGPLSDKQRLYAVNNQAGDYGVIFEISPDVDFSHGLILCLDADGRKTPPLTEIYFPNTVRNVTNDTFIYSSESNAAVVSQVKYEVTEDPFLAFFFDQYSWESKRERILFLKSVSILNERAIQRMKWEFPSQRDDEFAILSKLFLSLQNPSSPLRFITEYTPEEYVQSLCHEALQETQKVEIRMDSNAQSFSGKSRIVEEFLQDAQPIKVYGLKYVDEQEYEVDILFEQMQENIAYLFSRSPP